MKIVVDRTIVGARVGSSANGVMKMTRNEAAAKYANAYRAYAVAKGRTCNIDAATAFATSDVLNMTKHMSEENAVYVINDEAAFLMEAA